MTLIRAVNELDLEKILDLVHDRIFDLSDVVFDEDKGVVKIPLTVILHDKILEENNVLFFRSFKYPVVASTLIVNNAVSISIEDKDKIGQGCINSLVFNGHEVVLDNSVPVVIRIHVQSFEVMLSVTDHVLEVRSGFSLCPNDWRMM